VLWWWDAGLWDGVMMSHTVLLTFLLTPVIMEEANITCVHRVVAPEYQHLLNTRESREEEEKEEEEEGARCSYCHAVVQGDVIISQGCWLAANGCTSTSSCLLIPLGQNKLSFCCCQGDQCNSSPKFSKDPHNTDIEDVSDTLPESVPRDLHQTRDQHNSRSILSNTELGLLAALVLLLILLLLLLLLLARQQQVLSPASSHIVKCLNIKRSDTTDQCDQRPLLVGLGVSTLLGVEDRPILVGRGISRLLDVERG